MSMIGHLVAIPPAYLQDLMDDEERLQALLYAEEGEDPAVRQLDLDKEWHALHYLLSGSAWEGEGPWGWAVQNGDPTGHDVGYGPVTWLSAEKVAAVAAALATLDGEAFKARFDGKAMDAAEIYPQCWAEHDPEAAEGLRGYYQALQAFYQQAAACGDLVLQYID